MRLGWPVSNVWLLPDTPCGPLLIDCGFPALWPAILLGLRRHGLRPEQLAAVILTHRHSDHAGNAARLRQRHGVPIHAHAADAAVLRGEAPRPPLPEPLDLGGLMSRIENRLPVRVPGVRDLEQGQLIAGLEVIWVPGHTAGSIFLHHRGAGALFSGDALLNAIPPSTARSALSLPYPIFCEDHGRALRSLANVLARDLPVRTLYAGHGPPRRGEIDVALSRLLAGA